VTREGTTLLWYFVRRKRAADATDGSRSPSNPSNRPVISAALITSPDSPGPPPDAPLHQGRGFPTPLNTTEQTANDLCRGAITGAISADLYHECLNYTARDTENMVSSCVEDIKVTVRNLFVFITTFKCVHQLTQSTG